VRRAALLLARSPDPRRRGSGYLVKRSRFGMVAMTLLIAGWSLCACNGSCTIVASNYTTTCTVDADCVGIQAGDICDPNTGYVDPCLGCGSPNAAIARSSYSQYVSDIAAAPEPDGPNQCYCGPGPDDAFCDHGTCAVPPPPTKM
jgi:hypothetical protein